VIQKVEKFRPGKRQIQMRPVGIASFAIAATVGTVLRVKGKTLNNVAISFNCRGYIQTVLRNAETYRRVYGMNQRAAIAP
jgi:hypothetical protein